MEFILFIFVFCFLFCNPLQATSLSQVGDDLFYSSHATSPGSYFVMERVTPETSPIWTAFSVKEQETMNTLKGDCITSGYTGHLEMEIDAFSTMVEDEFVATQKTSSQIWVAYVLQATTPPESAINSDRFPSIKMALTSSTDPDAPFFMNFGGFLSPSHLLNMEEPPIQDLIKSFLDSFQQDGKPIDQAAQFNLLSLLLECFAATTIQTLYPEKMYMITKPLENMENILLHAFNSHSFWSINAETGQPYTNLYQQNQPPCPLTITGCIRRFLYTDWGENIETTATLKAPEGKNIWTLKSTETDRITENYKWFLDNEFFRGAGNNLVIIDASAMKEMWQS